MDLDTTYVDGGHIHVSSTKVGFCDDKSPTPTRCSHLRTKFHLKDNANKNYGFIVRSVAPLSRVQWSGNNSLVIYFGSDGTARIGRRHRERLFRIFESCIFVPSMHLRGQNKDSCLLQESKYFPHGVCMHDDSESSNIMPSFKILNYI